MILAEDQPLLGGALLAEPPDHPGAAWLDEARAELEALPEVRVLTRDHRRSATTTTTTSAWSSASTDHLGPAAPPHLPRQRLWKVRARQVVLATGAIERPLVFAENDRPGIMLAGAVRSYLHRQAVLRRPPGGGVHQQRQRLSDRARPARRGRGRGAWSTCARSSRARLPRRARRAGISRPGRLRDHRARAGRRRVSAVEVRPLDARGRRRRGRRPKPSPAIWSASPAAGTRPSTCSRSRARGRATIAARGIFLPGAPVQAERSAGACNGTFALARLPRGGRRAPASQPPRPRASRPRMPELPSFAEPEEAPARLLWQVPSGRPLRKSKMFVDLQNDVTAADLALALREGYRSIEHVKRYTTTGMGTDQGKTSNVNALGIVAEITRSADRGARRHHLPPALHAGHLRRDRRPQLRRAVRAGAAHADARLARGAGRRVRGRRPVAAALVLPAPGRGHARRGRARGRGRAHAGSRILDASTLGKIDIQGRDAAELLNRVYTNAWSKLAVGRCRYGLMLGEDGMVFDDGVTARLGEHHYLMSTTSGGAARVLAWLEEWLQTEWPELEVYCTSVTEQWATISLVRPGLPQARGRARPRPRPRPGARSRT